MISVNGLSYHTPRSNKQLIAVGRLQMNAGQFHVFLGPNGAGKSTLLKCLCGDLPDMNGQVSIADKSLSTYSKIELARRRAVLPQTAALPFAMSVRDIVAFGRDVYRQDAANCFDDVVIDQAMSWLDITHLAKKNYQQLSGGEQHRTHIARILTQILAEPDMSLQDKVLFLDEPTNHLDVRHQYSLMALLQQLKSRGLTIVCVLHDIALALNNADTLVLLKDGAMVGHFIPEQLASELALDEAYGIELNAHWSTHYQRYVMMP
ncbi:ATP-binding cassette domain-containing protein [Cardiobacteriaceae bacterium TAE3-ERU3]|nr:ATP-binding cassette domain-containing protein [Cardiobacteriaceae bacterium TAE3-ERU3]